jgi:hypothetical protein
MATLRGRPLAKLLSRHDPLRLHAACGAAAALHAAFRAARWLRTGSARFDASWATPACLLPHALLALSSLRFPVPARRNPAAPMLWPEARAHAAIFSARSIALMLLGWAVLRAPQRAAWLLYARGGVVLATQAAADAASARFAEHRAANGSTIRGMPWPPGAPRALVAAGRLFYSVAQLFASCMFVSYRLDTPFAVLWVVQAAAFGMTLCRKGLLSCAQWHAAYAAALAAVFAMHVASARVTHPSDDAAGAQPRAREIAMVLPAMVVLATARLRFGANKYALWAALWAAHAAAMRFGRMLDFVTV